MDTIILAISCVIAIEIGSLLVFADKNCGINEIITAIISFDQKFLSSHCDLKKAHLLRNILLVLMIISCIMNL